MWLIQLRSELWKLFGKQRTYLGFLMIVLAQNIFILTFRFSHASRNAVQVLEGNGYPAAAFMSGLTIATILIFPMVYLLLPLYTSLVGGDLVAKEAEDGTLRMILCRPISRVRLLVIKWLAGAIFALLLVLFLGVSGFLFASAWFGWGGLFVFVPGEIFSVYDPWSGLGFYVAAHGFMVIKAVTIMGLAFMVSCFNVKPAAATILALSLIFVSFIMMNIPYFKDLQVWFVTYHLNAWQWLFLQPVPYWKIASSMSLLAGFNFTFLLVGVTVFHTRDIKS